MTTYGKEAWNSFMANRKLRRFVFGAIIITFVLSGIVYLT